MHTISTDASQHQDLACMAFVESRLRMMSKVITEDGGDAKDPLCEAEWDGLFTKVESVQQVLGRPTIVTPKYHAWIRAAYVAFAWTGYAGVEDDDDKSSDEETVDSEDKVPWSADRLPASYQNLRLTGFSSAVESKIQALDELEEEPEEVEEEPGSVQMLLMTPMGPKFNDVGIVGAPLERGNYDEETLAKYDALARAISATRPIGRLSIVSGIPGTGKTWMLRGLIHGVREAVHVIVPAKEVSKIGDPALLTALLDLQQQEEHTRIVLYLEDADAALVKRTSENFSVVSALLNATDGMLGALLNLSVVATTNQELDSIDDAILRAGRLAVRMNVPALSPAKASEVYARLTQKTKTYSDAVSLAMVYEDAAKTLENV